MLDIVERLEEISELVKLGIIDADLVDDMIDELLLENLDQQLIRERL